MKKIALYLTLISLLLSCGSHDWNDTVIKNESEFEVVFKFNNTGKITLPPLTGETSFSTEANQYLESFNPGKRVAFNYESTNDGYTGWFKTLPSWEVKIQNSLNKEAVLSADGWMEDVTGIPANSDTKSGTIYTDKPVFTATAEEFPALTTWRFEDNKFWVLIHQ